MSLFRSVRFNIFVFCLLVLGSAVGTLLPQIGENPQKVHEFLSVHPGWGRFFQFLGLFDIYHSWYFIGLLALLAFDVVVCKLWKKPPDPGLIKLPPDIEGENRAVFSETILQQKPYFKKFPVPLDPIRTQAIIEKKLRVARYQVWKHPEGMLLTAARHRLQRWGSYIAHISLVLILGGALIKALFGFEEFLPILEGRSQTMQNKPWTVQVDKFKVEYYPNTATPRLFESALQVFDQSQRTAEKNIRVNDPLDIGGVRLYQASWGATGMFRSATLLIGDRVTVQASMGEEVKLPIETHSISVKAEMMLPNFIVKSGRADTESLEFKNPGVRFRFYESGKSKLPLWLFLNWPGLCFREGPDGMLSQAPDPPFRLVHVDPILFSGIQVAYDPGFPLLIIGCFFLVFGLSCLFYLHQRRLWVLLRERQGEPVDTEVVVGAWSSLGSKVFQKEFENLVRSICEEGEEIGSKKGPRNSSLSDLVMSAG